MINLDEFGLMPMEIQKEIASKKGKGEEEGQRLDAGGTCKTCRALPVLSQTV